MMRDIKSQSLFRDGDTLVIVLSPVVDLSIYTCLFNNKDIIEQNQIKQLLLDCSSVNEFRDSGIVAIRKLGEYAREQQIRLLILDPSLDISDKLDRILPYATWIDSDQKTDPVSIAISFHAA